MYWLYMLITSDIHVIFTACGLLLPVTYPQSLHISKSVISLRPGIFLSRHLMCVSIILRGFRVTLSYLMLFLYYKIPLVC